MVVDELRKIGFANMADYVSVDGDLDFAALTRDQTAALSEVSIENLGDGAKRVKFKLHDKQAALVSLGRQAAGPSAPILWVPPGTRS